MRTMYTVEVKTNKDSKKSMIVYYRNGLAIFEFKKYARSAIVEIYNDQRERLSELGLKPYARNRFVIKKYKMIEEDE